MTAFLLSVPTLAILAGACLVAMLYRRCAREVPILMYHRIAQIPGDRNSVPPAMFAAQLAYLQRHGYRTITLGALHTARTTGAALPAKSVILTFDDAYDDNLTVALPMLQQYGMVGAVGVITGWVGTPNDWEAYPGKPHCRTMTWAQLAQWQAAGMDIASHTVTHPKLSRLPEDDIAREVRESKATLEARLARPVEFLIYPYGLFDARVMTQVAAAGYLGALAIFDGTRLWRHDPYALRRVVISSRQPAWEFALKVSPAHLLFIGMRRLERALKRRR